MKRKFILIIVLALSIVLTSCDAFNSEFKMTADLINANLDYEEEPEIVLPTVVRSNLNDYTIANSQYLDKGVVLIRDEESRLSAWNFFEGRMLFPFMDYSSVNIIDSAYLGCYFKVVETDNMTTIYDINGNVVLEKGDYSMSAVESSRENVYDDDFKFLYYDYFEEVNYKLSGSDIINTINYKVDVQNKTREEVSSDSNQYVKSFPYKIDLKKVGLDGYYAIYLEPTMYIYKNNGELVNRLNISTSGYGMAFDGKFLIQNSFLTHFDNPEYDLLINNEKYIIETTSIDILTGKQKGLELDYLITIGKNLYDQKENVNLGYASIRKIVGKTKSASSINVIINTNGEILYNLGSINLDSLKKLEDNKYYCPIKRYLFNDSLEPLFAISGISGFINNEPMIIVQENEVFGIIDYSGNIIVPFEYSFISPIFYKGKTFATNSNGKNYIIDLENNAKELPDLSSILAPGIVLSFEQDIENSKTNFTISSYADDILINFDYFGLENPLFQNIETAYANGLITGFTNEVGKIEYIFLKYQ